MKRLILILTLLMPTLAMAEVFKLECYLKTIDTPFDVYVDTDNNWVSVTSRGGDPFWVDIIYSDETYFVWYLHRKDDFSRDFSLTMLNRKTLKLTQTSLKTNTPAPEVLDGRSGWETTCTRPF